MSHDARTFATHLAGPMAAAKPSLRVVMTTMMMIIPHIEAGRTRAS